MRLASENKLNSLEKPKNMVLLEDPFTIENVLTPTFKMRRNIAKVKYENDIKKMYKEGPVMKMVQKL